MDHSVQLTFMLKLDTRPLTLSQTSMLCTSSFAAPLTTLTTVSSCSHENKVFMVQDSFLTLVVAISTPVSGAGMVSWTCASSLVLTRTVLLNDV